MNDPRTKSLVTFAVSVLFWFYMTNSLAMAVGILLLILIHEMGHYFAARAKNIPVMLPVFTPLGAAVQLDQSACRSAKDEAFIAIAGPLVGGIASLIVLALGPILGSNLLFQLGAWGVTINLFNLVPLSPLDGGRISLAIERRLYLLGVPLFIYMLTKLGMNTFNLVMAFFILQFAWAEIQFRTQQAVNNPGFFAVGAKARIGYALAYVGLAALLTWVVVYPQGFIGLLVSLGL